VAHAAPLRDFSLAGRQISCWRHCSNPTSHTLLAGGPGELGEDQVAPSTGRTNTRLELPPAGSARATGKQAESSLQETRKQPLLLVFSP